MSKEEEKKLENSTVEEITETEEKGTELGASETSDAAPVNASDNTEREAYLRMVSTGIKQSYGADVRSKVKTQVDDVVKNTYDTVIALFYAVKNKDEVKANNGRYYPVSEYEVPPFIDDLLKITKVYFNEASIRKSIPCLELNFGDDANYNNEKSFNKVLTPIEWKDEWQSLDTRRDSVIFKRAEYYETTLDKLTAIPIDVDGKDVLNNAAGEIPEEILSFVKLDTNTGFKATWFEQSDMLTEKEIISWLKRKFAFNGTQASASHSHMVDGGSQS